jgi:hypothetical protein
MRTIINFNGMFNETFSQLTVNLRKYFYNRITKNGFTKNHREMKRAADEWYKTC